MLDDSAAALALEWDIDDVAGLTVAGWSLCHGLATLLLAGNLRDRIPPDPDALFAMIGNGLIGLGTVARAQASGG